VGLHGNPALSTDFRKEVFDLSFGDVLDKVARRFGNRPTRLKSLVAQEGLIEPGRLQYAPDEFEGESASRFLNAVAEHQHALNISRADHGIMPPHRATGYAFCEIVFPV
jgi:hypothetical protein